MKKVIRLTESDLMRIVKRVISEQPNVTTTSLKWKTPEQLKDDRAGKTYTTQNTNVITFVSGSISALTGRKITIPPGTKFTYTISKFVDSPNYTLAKVPDLINSSNGQKKFAEIRWTCGGFEVLFGDGTSQSVHGTSQYLHKTLKNLFCKTK